MVFAVLDSVSISEGAINEQTARLRDYLSYGSVLWAHTTFALWEDHVAGNIGRRATIFSVDWETTHVAEMASFIKFLEQQLLPDAEGPAIFFEDSFLCLQTFLYGVRSEE